ncbi:MAG: hypothetical protein NVV82_26320 [Sporocytophaga sp.]|nr:hypothetical protein [Sporocytophaga sp.]
MKILAIRIKNLASLEGITEIDFTKEPLRTAGIFAITGPTGAGKSTILDALCLALYEQTPRYSKSNDRNQSIQDISGNAITQSDPRKILRDGATDGYAEIDFVGVDGNRYRAQWNVRRARNRADGALQSHQVAFKNLDTNIDVQGTKTEILASITQKVGLTFDQFTRAVLLAQGDFTAFLKAPNSDKSELLEKLTGTQIYSEISKRIFENHRNEREDLNLLTAQKSGINILSEEELESLNKRMTELVQLLQDHQKAADALGKEIDWHEKLQILQKAFNESGLALEIAISQKEEAAERELKLAQVNQVQPLRVWVQGRDDQQKLLADKEVKLKDLESALQLQEEEQKKQNEQLNSAQQKLDLKTKDQEQAQPLLNQAKQLDTQLKDRVLQLQTAKIDLQQAKEIFTNQEEQIQNYQQRAEQLQQSIGRLEAYSIQHQSRKSLAENDQLVLTTLTDAQATLQEEQQLYEEIRRIQEILERKHAEEQKQLEVLDRARESELKLAGVYLQLQKKVSSVNSAALQQSKKEVEEQVMEAIQAVADWKTLFEATTAHKKAIDNLTINKEEQENIRKSIQDATKELESSQTRRDLAFRSWEIAKQELSQDVVNLRQQLTEDEPCPVCGSTEHPYASHDPRLDKVLSRLEADFKQQELQHHEALTIHTTLQEKRRQLEKDNASLSSEQLLQEQSISEYKKNWSRFTRYIEAENRPSEEVSGWLKQQLTASQNQHKKLQEEYDLWQKQQLELEEHKNRHESAKEHYRVTEDTLKDLRRTIESHQEKLEQAQKELSKAERKLAQTQEALASYFTNKDWLEHWKKDADTFTKRIIQFASDWKANKEGLDRNRRDQEVLTSTIKGEESNRELLAKEVIKKTKVASEFSQEYETLIEERKQLFDGRPTDEIEAQLKAAIDKAREELEQHKTKQEHLRNTITSSITKRDEVKLEILRLSDEIKELDSKITQWLTSYNANQNQLLAREEMEVLLTLPYEWIETERKSLQQLNDSLLKAQTVLNGHKTALEKHQEHPLSQRSMEAVIELLTETRSMLQDTVREDTEAKFRLKHDANNRKKVGALLEQITVKEKVVDNWAKLNHVIGSADGKKFRQVAQEYTLDVLLEYTNVQLDMLSKRYVLQRIPGSLGLQVIDQDMGKEVRTVNSLSGGESFLVSLALALGLASLSSSRMQVESLFIDEGFGSLDPNTLNIAMDALERLHNQGRKVGVISHVQEMTERIPVQIKVSKQQSGRSMVKVIGL